MGVGGVPDGCRGVLPETLAYRRHGCQEFRQSGGGYLGAVAVLNLLGALIGFSMMATPITFIPGAVILASGITCAALFGGMSALVSEAKRIRRVMEVNHAVATTARLAATHPTPPPTTPTPRAAVGKYEAAAIKLENERRDRREPWV